MPFGAQKLFPLKYSVLWKLSFEHFFVESALFDILSAHDVMHCLYASMLSSSRSDMSIMLWNFGTEKLSSPYSPRRDAVTLVFVKETLPPPCQSSIATVAFV